MCLELSLRQRENLVEIPSCNLEIQYILFFWDQLHLYFLVIFEFAHFFKILENGSMIFFDTSTSRSWLYQKSVVKMFLRLIIWNIYKSIGEENALTEGKNCVTKSRLTIYFNIKSKQHSPVFLASALPQWIGCVPLKWADGKQRKNVGQIEYIRVKVSRDFVTQRFQSLQLSSLSLNLEFFKTINLNETSTNHCLAQH